MDTCVWIRVYGLEPGGSARGLIRSPVFWDTCIDACSRGYCRPSKQVLEDATLRAIVLFVGSVGFRDVAQGLYPAFAAQTTQAHLPTVVSTIQAMGPQHGPHVRNPGVSAVYQIPTRAHRNAHPPESNKGLTRGPIGKAFYIRSVKQQEYQLPRRLQVPSYGGIRA